ncbi:MAG TPA: hydrogenase expression/formation protein HypE, partial [Holophagaceae bacterium]
ALSCPRPLAPDTVQMAHGGGGRRMKELIEGVFLPALGTDPAGLHDSAVLEAGGGRLAFTTDGFVVHPRRFPGGDLGELAVYGTVNDLAMAGARPLALSAAFILEEGLPLEELAGLVASMKAAADRCGVRIVTGDTKVVDRGKGDGAFITTTGLGLVPAGVDIHPRRVRPGDAVLVTGDLGRHGIAVMSVREGLAFETPIASDCGPVHHLAAALLEAGLDVHCLRDPTRGGLASVLNEIAAAAGVAIEAREEAVPVAEAVAAACEILGLDPLYVACEGRMVAFLPEAQAARALDLLRAHPEGAGAAVVGRVLEGPAGRVTLRTTLGTARLLDLLSGEQLPRIC